MTAVLLFPIPFFLRSQPAPLPGRGSRPFAARLWLLLAVLLMSAPAAFASDPSAEFDAANKLYEQGKFPEAAAAYEKLVRSEPRSAALYFNLGNAWFKAGQMGRAIAAWKSGESVAPRDPDLRFNLQFARKKVTGSDIVPGSAWQRALTALTLNEWSVMGACALWLWFTLLALREIRPKLRAALSGYTATAGVVALIVAGCIAAAANLRFHSLTAVVVVPDAIARSGPFEEAQVRYQSRDGTELAVVDQKDLMVGSAKQAWLQVRDRSNRLGWLRRDQVIVID